MDVYNQDVVWAWVQSLIDEDNLHAFYTSPQWLRLRAEVLAEHKYECQDCKAQGFYKKADTVHHEQYIKKHPRLALSKTYEFKGKTYRQLTPLCHSCHERRHEYRRKVKAEPLTPERW